VAEPDWPSDSTQRRSNRVEPCDGTRAHLEREIFAHGEVYGQGTISGWDWRFGVLTLVAFVGVVMLTLGYGLMADKNTRYPFEPWEMARWNRLQHLTRAGITPLPLGTGSS